MKRAIRWYDYITINIYWFALTTRSQVISPLILPILVQKFVGDAVKGTYLGNVRLWALMVAVLVQAFMGMVSDQNSSRWGKRRPFLVAGTIGEIFVFILIGFTAGLEGLTGYWILFALYTLSMLSSNTAQGALLGLIPDLVPSEKRGKFSGVKALLELPIPLVFVSYVVGKMVSSGNLWGAIFTVIVVLLVSLLISLFVPEEKSEKIPSKLDWQPIIRLILMTAAFTIVILGMGFLVKKGILFSISLNGISKWLLTGIIGVAGMAVAVALGVWGSVRISIGKEAKENPSFTWWVVNRLAFMVGSTNLSSFMLYFLQERFVELSGEKAAGPAAKIVMFVGVFILLSAIPSGWLSDRFGKKPLIAASGFLAVIGTAIVIMIPNLTATYFGGCFVGAGIGLFYAANWALGTEIVPKDQAGRYLGISNLAGAGAGAIGAYIGGPIADQMGYVILMSIYGILFLLSIIALLGIKEPKVHSEG